MRRDFSGFPARARSTPLPDLFFAQVLPQLRDLAEVKVVLHIFWTLYRKKGYPRYVTRSELGGDPVLGASLGGGVNSSIELDEALGKATNRGVLLRLSLDRNGRREELYMVNNVEGRQALEALEERAVEVGEVVAREEPWGGPWGEKPNIFALYEETIGLLNLPIAEELKEAEAQYPGGWIAQAFQEAAELNVRNWRYVRRILERWAREGKDSGAPRGVDKTKVGRYVQGRRGPLVPWR